MIATQRTTETSTPQKTWMGNPFINQADTWSERINQEWYKLLDATSTEACLDEYFNLSLILGGADPLVSTDRVYYNKITKKIISECDSSNWLSDFSREENATDMTEDEVIEEYTSVGFKVVSKTNVGVTLQKIDHSGAGKHLYHIDDRRALGLRI